jgi:hypothetical protein
MARRLLFAAFPLLAAAFPFLVLPSGSAGPRGKSEEEGPAPVALYHADRNHLWNRLHAALMERVGPDGKTYGADRLEPLLWLESKHLLEGKAGERAVAVLEEFVEKRGEMLIDDPVKRALLQRDLWLVASWLMGRTASDARKRLEVPLAKAIRRLALTPEQIAKLPDNYSAAVASERFAARFDPERPERSYLPPDLFKPDGPWVCVGRKGGPVAPLHLDTHNPDPAVNPFTNSAFLVFLKLPGGRDATLRFLKELAAFDKPLHIAAPDETDRRNTLLVPNPALPQMPKGAEVALVRRALLIDSSRRVVASPLVESVQLRVMRVETPRFSPKTFEQIDKTIGRPITEWQAFGEFQLRRAPLFASDAGGLRDVSAEGDFKTGFNTHHWDDFTTAGNASRPFPERAFGDRDTRSSCVCCHQLPGTYGFNSFHTLYSTAARRYLKGETPSRSLTESHVLVATPVRGVEGAAVKWTEGRPAWKSLRRLLPE